MNPRGFCARTGRCLDTASGFGVNYCLGDDFKIE